MAKKKKKTSEELLEEFEDLCQWVADATEVKKKETENEKRKRIERLLLPENFADFCKYYFSHYIDSDFAWFHLEAAKEYTTKNNSFTINEWPREHAKSVFINVFCQLWLYFNDKLTGFILGSADEIKAKELIGDIEAELRENKKLIADFGPQNVTGSFLKGRFFTSKRVGFWGFGIGQNPAGVRKRAKRPNSGVIDDADSKKKYGKNQDRLEEDMDWILGEFMNCLSTRGKHFSFNNNRVCENGLTAHMVGDVKEGDPKRKGARHIKAFATEDPQTHEMLLIENGGVPSWNRYTIEHLLTRFDEIGYRNTMRQFYHKHIKKGKLFKSENLPWVNTMPWGTYDALASYLDPAYGKSGKGCYRALVLIGRIGLNYDVLYAWMRTTGNMVDAQYRLDQKVREELKKANSVPGKKGGFKTVRFKSYTEAGDLQKEHLKKTYKLADIERDQEWSPKFDDDRKGDKIGRIETLETTVEGKYIRFSKEMKKNTDMQTLRDQMIEFPSGFIDGPDALHGGKTKVDILYKSGNFKGRTGSFNKNKNRSLV